MNSESWIRRCARGVSLFLAAITIVTLPSTLDALIPSAITWSRLFHKIIDAYRFIIYPLLDLAPIKIPDSIKDLVVFVGLVLSVLNVETLRRDGKFFTFGFLRRVYSVVALALALPFHSGRKRSRGINQSAALRAPSIFAVTALFPVMDEFKEEDALRLLPGFLFMSSTLLLGLLLPTLATLVFGIPMWGGVLVFIFTVAVGVSWIVVSWQLTGISMKDMTSNEGKSQERIQREMNVRLARRWRSLPWKKSLAYRVQTFLFAILIMIPVGVSFIIATPLYNARSALVWVCGSFVGLIAINELFLRVIDPLVL